MHYVMQLLAIKQAAADQRQAEARQLAMVEARVRKAVEQKDDVIASLHEQLAATLRRLREADELLEVQPGAGVGQIGA